MNLAAYDKVNNKIDKTKTWLDHNNKRIVSKQIKYRTYYAFGKRYNPNTDKEEFYLITSDNIILDRPCYKTIKDNYNRLKYNLGSVYNDCFKEVNKDISINLILDSSQEDGEVYRFH